METGRVEINICIMKQVVVRVDWVGNFCACPENSVVCCVVTGDTLQEVKDNMAESLRWHIEGMQENDDVVPDDFVGDFAIKYELSAVALLKSMQTVVTQTALSRSAGINLQQLNHYCSGKRRPRVAQRARIVGGLHKIGRELLSVE
jgi:predicted RNase H-like HicB family nuclease